MKRTKKGLALSRETLRPLTAAILDGVGGAYMIQSKMCSTDPNKCWTSTDLKCPTFGSDCCLASVIVC
ncbi:MAG TPA: hypothetical protein VL463_17630 [Kofleriaceae bacterium]|nr:hypothetical protein [Kofleriaceae bacterium]